MVPHWILSTKLHQPACLTWSSPLSTLQDMTSQPEAGDLKALIRSRVPIVVIESRDDLQATRPLSVVMAERVSAMRQWAADRTVSAVSRRGISNGHVLPGSSQSGPNKHSIRQGTQRKEYHVVSRVRLEMPERFLFTTEVPLRVSDINYGGHLGNDAVLSLAQEARMRFLRSHNWTEQDVTGVGIIMTDAAVVYRSEAFYGDVLKIDVAVADMGQLGCDFLFRMVNKASGKEVAQVKTGIVFFDYAKRKPSPVPAEFRSVCGSSSPPARS
jgi:acyl-CoA thioester hydrolase